MGSPAMNRRKVTRGERLRKQGSKGKSRGREKRLGTQIWRGALNTASLE
jgi:hypothetical protein